MNKIIKPFMPPSAAERAATWRRAFIREATVTVLGKIRGIVTRAAVSQMKVADLPGSPLTALLTLAPDAASTAVLALGTEVDMRGVSIYNFPLAESFTNAGWVGEGMPIRVGQGVFAAMPLTLHKLALIGGLSDELQDATDGAASTTIEHTIEVVIGRGLDAALFSADAAVPDLSPAGLLYGVAPLTGSASMSKDLGALVGAISAANINTESIIFVAAAEQATAIKLAAGPLFNHRVVGANLTPGVVIAVATAGLATCGEGAPEITTSKFAALHMSDAPVNIGSGAGVAAAPSLSTFQTATFALRVVARIGWAAAPGSVAVASGCTW